MADNTFQNGTSNVATDDIGGVHYQIIKPAFGALDTATLVTASVGLPTDPIDRSGRLVGVVTQQTITKGTQGTTGVTTQDLKDAGRVIFSMATAIAGVTAVTTEALLTMVAQRDGTAAGTATTQAVTSAKRLRITSMAAGIISTGATVLSARISLRMTSTGAASASSPIVHTLAIPSGAALAQAGGALVIDFPDGIEFSGTMQIGVSQVCSATSGTVWVTLAGYEY